MQPDEAVEKGALALFGEKYGDEVRVISMGADAGGRPYSVELCGGTHVRRTGDIGQFKIVSEAAVAAGVRRIEALTGAAALSFINARLAALDEAARVLRASAAELPARLEALLEDRKRLERDLADTRRKMASGGGNGAELRDVAGIRYSSHRLDGVPPKDLRGLADEAKKKLGSGVVAIATVNDGKAAIVVAVSDDLTGRCSAVDLVRVAAQEMGGKGGGGRADMAQAGGPDGGRADAAFDAIERSLAGLG
jgi:alanyl-tRNA synthetase